MSNLLNGLQREPTTLAQLTLPDPAQFLGKTPVEYVKPEWPCQRIGTPEGLKYLADLLRSPSKLSPEVPCYPVIGLDCETAGDKRDDGKMTDLSKHLCYIQMALPHFKVVEEQIESGPSGDRRCFTKQFYVPDLSKPGLVFIINVLELAGRHLRLHPRAAKGIWTPEDNPWAPLKRFLKAVGP